MVLISGIASQNT
jgi:hypothetical protein